MLQNQDAVADTDAQCATASAFADNGDHDGYIEGHRFPEVHGDGLGDVAESCDHGTDPALSDTDGDGLDDSVEVAAVSDPLLADSDGDGLSDFEELPNPSNPGDLDGDGIADIAVGAPTETEATGSFFVSLLNADGTTRETQQIDGNTAFGHETLPLIASSRFGRCLAVIDNPSRALSIAVGSGATQDGKIYTLSFDYGVSVSSSSSPEQQPEAAAAEPTMALSASQQQAGNDVAFAAGLAFVAGIAGVVIGRVTASS